VPLMQAAADASFHEAQDRVAFRDPVVSERVGVGVGGTTLTMASVVKDQFCNQLADRLPPEIACRSVAGFRTTMGVIRWTSSKAAG